MLRGRMPFVNAGPIRLTRGFVMLFVLSEPLIRYLQCDEIFLECL